MIKQATSSLSSLLTGAAKAPGRLGGSLFWGTGVTTIGTGMAAFSLGGWLQSPGRSQNITDSSRNPYNTHNFKESGFFRRQATVAALGLTKPGAGGFSGSLDSLAYYNAGRTKDFLESSMQLRAPIAAGAAGGAGIGAVTGLAASAFSKLPIGKTVPWLAAMGAVAGGYNARKVSLQVVEGFNVAKKNSINRRRLSARASTRGSGYRLWTNANRMGKPGHLGMDGSVPFSMHAARRRSTL